MKILAIESSCDETAAAVVQDGRTVLSSIVASQIEEHRLYGGVVPEIASRRHCESIVGVVDEALTAAGVGKTEIDAVAVTYAPGLIGALLVGVNFAKGLSASLEKPLIPVHHIRGHIAANYIAFPELKPPFLAFVLSGGHTHLIEVKDYTEFEIIGGTCDDAVGEAYDKAARAMGYPYPGGIEIDRAAGEGNPDGYKLPRPRVEGNELSMSFSGLKTAVLNTINNSAQKGVEIVRSDLCASFQKAVCDILSDRLTKAIRLTGMKTVAAAGGVSANSGIRAALQAVCEKEKAKLYLPPLSLCGDNAAMIGAQAYFEFMKGNISDLSLNAAATKGINQSL